MTELLAQTPLAFAAGLLSVLSPCVMPLMPAYLSLVSGISVEEMEAGVGDRELRRQVMKACTGFVLGFSVVFVVMGIGAVALGHTIRTWRADLFGWEFGISQLAGIVIMLLGVHMSGLLPIQWLYRDTRLQFGSRNGSVASAMLVGAGFGLGWTPCIGPILTGVLTLAGSRDTMGEGTVLLIVYSAGLAIPFLAAGWSIEYFFRAFGRVKKHFRAFEIVSGGILMGAGLLLVTDRLTWFNKHLSFLNDIVTSAERMLQ